MHYQKIEIQVFGKKPVGKNDFEYNMPNKYNKVDQYTPRQISGLAYNAAHKIKDI